MPLLLGARWCSGNAASHYNIKILIVIAVRSSAAVLRRRRQKASKKGGKKRQAREEYARDRDAAAILHTQDIQ